MILHTKLFPYSTTCEGVNHKFYRPRTKIVFPLIHMTNIPILMLTLRTTKKPSIDVLPNVNNDNMAKFKGDITKQTAQFRKLKHQGTHTANSRTTSLNK